MFILSVFLITACDDNNDDGNNAGGNQPQMAKVIVNDNTRYALLFDKTLFSWASNEYGQLGLGNTQQINTPANVNEINDTINKIYTGISVYVLTNDNSLYSFGYNNFVVDGVSHTGFLGRDGLNTEQHKILFEK